MNTTTNVTTESPKSDVALREEAVLQFWQEHDIFKKTLEKDAPNGDFTFYDGPPFATGLPHYGHILAGTIKDAIPRFWTMNGYRVPRKWGWDCHGLPLENLIEKELGLATKRDIEEYGVKNFNEKARNAVMRYADEWRQIVPRMGRFVDMDDDYKTMDANYTESVWWVFKTLHDKGLVFEGFKGMHLCPRCGTTLSNFEVNQGYKDIKDIAVTVKLPLLDDVGEPTETSLLVWTTTPWTLPGNLAAAVHNDHVYAEVAVSIEEGVENVILAKERLTQLGTEEFELVRELKGSDLVGKKYQPPFPWLQEQEMEGKDNAWTIYHADYVELGEEGTGAVHLAPAYGEEDMELAKEKGVPIFHHVDESGHFKDFVADFAGQLVKPKDDDNAKVTHLDADIEIVKALKANGSLYKKENITHSYPHCWRCDTPLLNYATTSWFVNVQSIKDKLVAENNTVRWVPEHVGRSRFGKWLEGARDWAVSRQRYWGAPLPIWRNPDTGDYKVFGTLKELQQFVPKSGNTYLTMRHGESTKNVEGLMTSEVDAPYPLTEEGRRQIEQNMSAVTETVDVIVTSPVVRARETAELAAKTLGLDADSIVVDERIRETQQGENEGKVYEEYRKHHPISLDRFTHRPADGESWNDVRERMGQFLFALEEEYQGKTILIVSHGDPIALLQAAAAGSTDEEVVQQWYELYPKNGVVATLPFTPYPHNDYYQLDFHRPYIDEIELYDGEVKLERVPDVFDCWFESGSMPYGQQHYLGEPLSEFDPASGKGFPADFISESIDQTRGWFYSTMVLGVGLFGKSPFENVVTNGLVLAEDGRKMSKSLQNYPDPVELVDRQGADAMRFYLLSSSIIKAEDLNFSEKEVQELQRKNIGRLHNVLSMYHMFADGSVAADASSEHVLDRWVLARLNEMTEQITVGYTSYELDKATRPITDFIDDLSVWYLRRSRDRLKADDTADRDATLATLRHVLVTLAKVMAPAMPFYADYLYRDVRATEDPESVHLSDWPTAGEVDTNLLTDMNSARTVVSAALEARTKAGIKVRQPLRALTVSNELQEQVTHLRDVIAEEVNVKEVVFATIQTQIELNTEIDEALKVEGQAREFMRAVQGLRKNAGLEQSNRVHLVVQTSDAGEAVVKAHQVEIMKTVGADEVSFGDAAGEEVTADDLSFTVEMKMIA